MIENYHQLGVTKQRLHDFEGHLRLIEELGVIGDDLLTKAHRDSMASQIETFKAEISEFEAKHYLVEGDNHSTDLDFEVIDGNLVINLHGLTPGVSIAYHQALEVTDVFYRFIHSMGLHGE